jgi:hypothetical protein
MAECGGDSAAGGYGCDDSDADGLLFRLCVLGEIIELAFRWLGAWASSRARALVVMWMVTATVTGVLWTLTTACRLVADKRDHRSTRNRLVLALLLANTVYVRSSSSSSVTNSLCMHLTRNRTEGVTGMKC